MSHLWWVFHKDLLIGWRGRLRLVGVVAYTTVLLLLFAFAVGADSRALQDHGAAWLWLAVLSASTLLLVQSFQQETEGGAWEGLKLLPVHPLALYYGKALANLAILLVILAVCLPLGALLFGLPVLRGGAVLGGVAVLGAAGIAAPGTLYAALTARAESRHLLLPLLLFPLLVPPVVAAVRATDLAMGGDVMGQLPSWIGLLGVFDLLYWSLSGILFTHLAED